MTIGENVEKLLRELPEGVLLVAAVKGRQIEDIIEAVESGVTIIGENYLQETINLYEVLGKRVKWHFIGHLQTNKAKKAVRFFDMIETVDSTELAQEISRRSTEMRKKMPVLIEINSAREPQKHGVFPEDSERLIRNIASLPGIIVTGLMTMGPDSGDSKELRSYLSETRQVFEHIKQLNIPGVEIKYLSMGMSSSYKIALEEGANIVRIGNKIFSNVGI